MSVQDSVTKIADASVVISTEVVTLQKGVDALLATNAKLTDALSSSTKYLPTPNPAVSLKSILNCRKHAHVVGWFGNSDHTDVGYNSQNQDTIAWQMDQLIAKGIDGVNILFSGTAKTFTAKTAALLAAAAEKRGLIVSVMIDHEDSIPAGSFKWAVDNLMTGGTYWKRNGKRLLFVFDPPTAAQRAELPSDVALIYRNSNGLNQPKSAGCYGWPAPGNEPSYCSYFYQKTASAAAGQLVIPHVSPGFLGASWNQSPTFKPTPWRYGQEWIDSIQRVVLSNTNPVDVLIGTWNDHEEGTGVERSSLL